jgi:8-oxo-dGTP diphosphatase
LSKVISVMALPYKISTLVFIRNEQGELLMMQRRKHPNFGLWSCIGGKLEMAIGESPFQTAVREVGEEIGLTLTESDLHLWGIAAEKGYENQSHWLMFMFECHKRLDYVPADIDEGNFGFFSEAAIDTLPIPETDRQGLWPLYFKYRNAFVSLRVDCRPDGPLNFIIEEVQGKI